MKTKRIALSEKVLNSTDRGASSGGCAVRACEELLEKVCKGSSYQERRLRSEFKQLAEYYQDALNTVAELEEQNCTLRERMSDLEILRESIEKIVQIEQNSNDKSILSEVKDSRLIVGSSLHQLQQLLQRVLEFQQLQQEVVELRTRVQELSLDLEHAHCLQNSGVRQEWAAVGNSMSGKKFVSECEQQHEERRSSEIVAKLQVAQERSERWRNLYLQEVRRVLRIQENTKLQTEEVLCAQQLVQQLEGRLARAEERATDASAKLYARASEQRIENARLFLQHVQQFTQVQPQSTDDLAAQLVKTKCLHESAAQEAASLCEVNADLRAQIDVLVRSREDLQRNLQMARVELMQAYTRLEDEQSKIIALEDTRLADTKYILNLEKRLEEAEKNSALLHLMSENSLPPASQQSLELNHEELL